MAICPKCKAEIDYLNNYQTGESHSHFDGEDYETEDFQADGQTNDYECPECSETLFTNEEEATKFLK